MKKFSKSHHSTMGELNITPLLDLAFVLLVIFIITTPQMSNDLEMNLPSAKPSKPAGPPPKLNYIDVDEAGKIALNQQTMNLAALKQVLVAMKKDDADTSVVVRGGNDVEYQKIISVLDVLQQADVTKVGLATETAAPPAQ